MGKIVILDENTSNKIAAGEVIERPASVVKELIENSIDAGARSISVEIKNGGVSLIKVTDNGCGIDEDDAEIAFERHATSKIRNANDLESIATMGFRGEALASIAAVSTVELTSRVHKNSHGTLVRIQGGVVKEVKQTGCPVGTTIIIKDLFYNTPARFKFLKKDVTEAGYISDIISRIALGNPEISIRLISNNITILHTPGNNELLSTIFSIYGKETAKELCEIKYKNELVEIWGYAGKAEIARSSRNHQSIYINRRYIKSKVIASSIDEAYKTFLLKNKFPFIVMNLSINPMLVDVNVHPTKMEVRFSDEQEIFRGVLHSINNALLGKSLIKEVNSKVTENFKISNDNNIKKEYTQQNFDIKSTYVKEDTNHQEYKNITFEPRNNVQIFENKNSEVQTEHIKTEEKTSLSINEENTSFMALVEPKQSEDKKGDNSDNKEWINVLLDSKIIGQAFSTYIILQNVESMVLIDQHAAHERIMFTRLKNKYLNNEPLSQMLLASVVIELTFQELKFLENHNEFFKKIGFTYDNFGNNSIILRSVPYSCDEAVIQETFLYMIDYVMNSNKKHFDIITDDVLYTIACKAAVKAKQKLDDSEINNLLKDLTEVENPFTCPHGRPTMIKLTKYELEKMFKRIV